MCRPFLTDFVLAALGEELGLIGTLAVVGLYLALVHRAFRLHCGRTREFGMLLAAGLGTILGSRPSSSRQVRSASFRLPASRCRS